MKIFGKLELLFRKLPCNAKNYDKKQQNSHLLFYTNITKTYSIKQIYSVITIWVTSEAKFNK